MSTKKTPARMRLAPTQEEVAVRAYQLFLDRGGAPGHELDDWLEAERQLLQERAAPPTANHHDSAIETAALRSASGR